ncbi:glucan endo-1,3-beta-glucosidase-like [Phragmites australis]|uniref:glucan endo-1,3-beta-glucosidase-like n=1 Tax=Phragmites australis TaxID=29695 RepID=UPI002D785FC7|nr:glucan endo-1,3-beta-glucosidase-like [Phragmites australis]
MLGTVLILLPMLLSVSVIKGTDAGGIGVNYGTRAATLPPPADVVQFLARDTIVDRVRLFDADPLLLRAFADTGLAVDVTVPNGVVPRLASLAFARRWVRENVAPYGRATNISRVLVGHEVTTEANRTLLLSLVPAMHNMHRALAAVSLNRQIKVSTTHSLGVLATSAPPSAGRFRDGYDAATIKPLLSFLRATGAPFMVNAYPFYGLTNDTLDFALFRVNVGAMDDGSGLVYSNMLDAQLDAVHSAIRRLGFGDVDIVVAETGWPSAGEDWEVGVGADLARDYNKNAIRHLGSGVGTPLMPNRTFEVSIFSLFDENLKPGPVSERNFGLFRADMTPVYDVGILIAPETVAPVSAKVAPASGPTARRWCVPKPAADEMVLQENIDFVCGQEGIDCSAIRPGGICYEPDTVQGHAAYAMNLYFQSNGQHAFDCDFVQTGVVTTTDPSYGGCKFI